MKITKIILIIFLVVTVTFILFNCTYESNHNYISDPTLPPPLHSECDDVGQVRTYKYGDYHICVECMFDQTEQYGYYKYWEEINCEEE